MGTLLSSSCQLGLGVVLRHLSLSPYIYFFSPTVCITVSSIVCAQRIVYTILLSSNSLSTIYTVSRLSVVYCTLFL